MAAQSTKPRTALSVWTLLLFLACPWAMVLAAAPPEQNEVAAVASVIDGDTLVLGDSRQVRLVGIQAPKLPLGRPDFDAWPLADEAKAALETLTLGRQVRLTYGGQRLDRHGRLLAHLYVQGDADEELWVQGWLLESGMARVYSFADNRALVEQMLRRETLARQANRGIWADPYYAVRAAQGLTDSTAGFQLVEGQVLTVAKVRGRYYLNFGADWRHDFTIVLQPAVGRKFESEGLDPLRYENERVRVRGWVQSFNGPMIEVTHPEQIEVLSP